MLPDLRFVLGAVLAAAMLVMVSAATLAVIRLKSQTTAGPLQSTRTLGFDERADWNQFQDPETVRRFGALAADAADVVAKRSLDQPLDLSPPVAPADAAPEHAPERPAEMTAVVRQELPTQQMPERPVQVAQAGVGTETPAERGPEHAVAATTHEIAIRVEAPAARSGIASVAPDEEAAAETAAAAFVPALAPKLSADEVMTAAASTLADSSLLPPSAPARAAEIAPIVPAPEETPRLPEPPAAASAAPAADPALRTTPEGAAKAGVTSMPVAPHASDAAAPAATRMVLWQDEPLFIVEDTIDSTSSAAPPPVAEPASRAVAIDVAEQPVAAPVPRAREAAPRARKLSRPAKPLARTSEPARARAAPTRRRAGAPQRRSGVEPQVTLDRQLPGYSYSPQGYAPQAPQRPVRRQGNEQPLGQPFGPAWRAY